MDKETFLLEQYKSVRESARRHGEVRFQMLVLCLTGFAAIFGLSNVLAEPVIPFALLALLLLCSRISLNAKSQGAFKTAFLIERYGATFQGDVYEVGHAAFREHVGSPGRPGSGIPVPARGFLRRGLGFSLDPFVVLTGVSLIGGAVVSWQFWLSLRSANQWGMLLLCALVLLVGHGLVLYLVHLYRKRTLRFFRGWWREYLNASVPGLS